MTSTTFAQRLAINLTRRRLRALRTSAPALRPAVLASLWRTSGSASRVAGCPGCDLWGLCAWHASERQERTTAIELRDCAVLHDGASMPAQIELGQLGLRGLGSVAVAVTQRRRRAKKRTQLSFSFEQQQAFTF